MKPVSTILASCSGLGPERTQKPPGPFIWEARLSTVHDFLLLYRDLAVEERNQKVTQLLNTQIEAVDLIREEISAGSGPVPSYRKGVNSLLM